MHALLFGVAPRNGDIDDRQPARWPRSSARRWTRRHARPRVPPARLGRHRARASPASAAPTPSRCSWTGARAAATTRCGTFSSMPQVLGHEVVAEVVALGPEAEGVDDRRPGRAQPVAVVRAARRVTDLPRVRGRRPQPVLELPDAADRARHPHRHVEGRAAAAGPTLMPAHQSMLFPVPDYVPDEVAVFADPFAVSLHAITRHPPPPGGKVLVYGAGALGTLRDRDPARAVPRRRGAASSRASARRPSWRASSARTGVRARAGRVGDRGGRRVVGRRAARRTPGCRWRSPVASTSCTTPSASRRRSRSASALLKAHGTLVKAGVHGPTNWEYTPLYFKETQLGRLERVRVRGGRRRAQARHRTTTSIWCEPAASTSPACSRTRSRSTSRGATRSACSPPRTTPARSRSRSTNAGTDPASARAGVRRSRPLDGARGAVRRGARWAVTAMVPPSRNRVSWSPVTW